MAKNLTEWMSAQPIERQQRIKARADQTIAAIKLAELRKQLMITQAQLADRMHVSQSSISQIESQGDVQLSTIVRYVQALGGTLHIQVNMPNGSQTTLC